MLCDSRGLMSALPPGRADLGYRLVVAMTTFTSIRVWYPIASVEVGSLHSSVSLKE